MAGNVAPNIVTDGLVLYLDAANTKSYVSGNTTWNDISRSGYNGTLTNGPTFNGSNGGSISFDGTNDYFNIPQSITNTMNTISIWVNMQSTADCPILYYGSDTYNSNAWTWGFAIYPTGTHGFNEYALGYPTTLLYTESVNVGVWKNFTMVRNDNGSVKLYKNGVLVGTKIGSGTTTIRDNGDRLYIAKAGTTYGNFYLSNVLTYNRALTSTEILQNYNALKGRYL